VASTSPTLLLSEGLAGVLVDQGSRLAVTIVLGLLGVGWNAAVVGASATLAASAPAALCPRVEGVGEFAMGVAAAAGAPAAGLVSPSVASRRCAPGAAAAALALTTVRWHRRSSPRSTTATNRQP
jgi:hypothetical protein